METPVRSDSSPLDSLVANSKQYEFYTLVKLLLKNAPEKVPPGKKGPYRKELIRFRSNPSLAFPSTDIEGIETMSHESREKLAVMVNTLGLFGSTSPLPAHYSESILHEIDEQNMPRQFLDLFNHRLISLLYRVCDKYNYLNHYRSDVSDAYSVKILSFMGLGNVNKDKNAVLEWNRLLPLARLLSGQGRSAKTLERALTAYFGCHCRIESFIPEHVALDPDQQTRLGSGNNSLGRTSIAGKSILSSSTRFRLHIGPVNYETYLRFLPGKRWHAALRELMATLMTDSLAYDVWIKLKADNVPSVQLSEKMPARLGWTSWVGRSSGDYLVIKQSGTT
jgi:type VI secretion system protein ImpH